MEMGDIKYKEEHFTWANNKEGEGLSKKGLIGFLDLLNGCSNEIQLL